MNRKRVVITGVGVVSSIGLGKDDFWNSLIAGKSGISEVDAFDTSEHANHYAGQIKNFKPEEFINKRKIKLIGRASQLAIAAAKLAMEDAGVYKSKDLDYKSSAVIIGTTSGEIQELEKIDVIWVKEKMETMNLWPILLYPENNIISHLSREFKFMGINRLFTTACASGNYAIGYGFDLLQLGKAKFIIAGGTDAFSYISFTGFSQLKAMAPKICQPFDKNRKGMLLGEGAGILILETLESALKRNANIYAEVLGYGLSCDANHMANPQAEGIARCIKQTLLNSSLFPADIDYICAHGTGTRNNDKAESLAIKEVFGNKKIPTSSIKSMLGHTMGAASAIEAIACCLAIKNEVIPPTINYETPDPDCELDCVPNTARIQKINVVLNNGFAFGGNNSCLALRKFVN